MRIIYCPTERIVAVYFTKPLHGSLFRNIGNAIMGILHPHSLILIKKHVENKSDKPIMVSIFVEKLKIII